MELHGMAVVCLQSWGAMLSSWTAVLLLMLSLSAQVTSDGQDTITEYYELIDEGEEICDGRTDGPYPLRDVRKYLICDNHKIHVKPCNQPLVYDLNIQRCGPLANISKDHFCRFRGDGKWQSPWDTHEIMQCNKGNTTVGRCEEETIYDPESNGCISESVIGTSQSVSYIQSATAQSAQYKEEVMLDMCDNIHIVNAKMGCYKKEHMSMDLLIDDDKTRLNWSKFTESVQSLLCRCSKKAYASGYTYIAIRLFAQCWAGRNRTALDAFLTDPTNKHDQYCYSNISKTNFENCNDRDMNVCVGSEYGQYIYDLEKSRKPDAGNNATSSRSPTKQEDFIDLITANQLQLLMRMGNTTLVDVRETFEVENDGRIASAINIPLKELDETLKLADNLFVLKYGIMKPSKEQCSVVFCSKSNERSDMAYKIAKENGYKCPKSFRGDFDGLPKVARVKVHTVYL